MVYSECVKLLRRQKAHNKLDFGEEDEVRFKYFNPAEIDRNHFHKAQKKIVFAKNEESRIN